MALLNGAKLFLLGKHETVKREIPIRSNHIKFGSHPLNTVRLKSEALERLHCKIFVRNQKVFVANYSTQNPIAVDGQFVVKKKILPDGSILDICGTRFRWQFDESKLVTKVQKSAKPSEQTPTNSRQTKRRRTTILRKKQTYSNDEKTNLKTSGIGTRNSDKKLIPAKRQQKSTTYTLPKSNRQLMKNIRKRFTVHSIAIDNEMDATINEEVEDTKYAVSDTPEKPSTKSASKSNTPFFTPDLNKENMYNTPNRDTTKTPSLQLENSAMMILSYTPSISSRSKANIPKTPLSSAKPTNRSGYLTPKIENISVCDGGSQKLQTYTKAVNSMYLIDLTTPTSGNSSFVCSPIIEKSTLPESPIKTPRCIDLTTPSPKKLRTSTIGAKSAQKCLLKSALKNASRTPINSSRFKNSPGTTNVGTPKTVTKLRKLDSPQNIPVQSAGNKTPTRTIESPTAKSIVTPNKSSISNPEINDKVSEQPETPVMTTDELFDTLVGRNTIRKTYGRTSVSPKKIPIPLHVSPEGNNELPKTDVDLWVESVVKAVTSPEPLDMDTIMNTPNPTKQVRSSQYSDITPNDSISEETDAVTEATTADQSDDVIDDELANVNDQPILPNINRRSNTPITRKIVRTLGNKRQTIGNFFTNIFGKLTVSPVTRVSIIDNESFDNTIDVESEDIESHKYETGSEGSDDIFLDSESSHQQENLQLPTATPIAEAVVTSPKLRVSLRDTRKLLGNALTSLNTSRPLLDNTADIDESLLLNETNGSCVADPIDDDILEEHYDLTDLSNKPEVVDVQPIVRKESGTKSTTSRRTITEEKMVDNLDSGINRTSVSLADLSKRQLKSHVYVENSPLAIPIESTPSKKNSDSPKKIRESFSTPRRSVRKSNTSNNAHLIKTKGEAVSLCTDDINDALGTSDNSLKSCDYADIATPDVTLDNEINEDKSNSIGSLRQPDSSISSTLMKKQEYPEKEPRTEISTESIPNELNFSKLEQNTTVEESMLLNIFDISKKERYSQGRSRRSISLVPSSTPVASKQTPKSIEITSSNHGNTTKESINDELNVSNSHLKDKTKTPGITSHNSTSGNESIQADNNSQQSIPAASLDISIKIPLKTPSRKKGLLARAVVNAANLYLEQSAVDISNACHKTPVSSKKQQTVEELTNDSTLDSTTGIKDLLSTPTDSPKRTRGSISRTSGSINDQKSIKLEFTRDSTIGSTTGMMELLRTPTDSPKRTRGSIAGTVESITDQKSIEEENSSNSTMNSTTCIKELLNTPTDVPKHIRGSIMRTLGLTNDQESVNLEFPSNSTMNSTTGMRELLKTPTDSFKRTRDSIASTVESIADEESVEEEIFSDRTMNSTTTTDVHKHTRGSISRTLGLTNDQESVKLEFPSDSTMNSTTGLRELLRTPTDPFKRTRDSIASTVESIAVEESVEEEIFSDRTMNSTTGLKELLNTPTDVYKHTRGSISRTLGLTNDQESVTLEFPSDRTMNSTTGMRELMRTPTDSFKRTRASILRASGSINVREPVKVEFSSDSSMNSTTGMRELLRTPTDSPKRTRGSIPCTVESITDQELVEVESASDRTMNSTTGMRAVLETQRDSPKRSISRTVILMTDQESIREELSSNIIINSSTGGIENLRSPADSHKQAKVLRTTASMNQEPAEELFSNKTMNSTAGLKQSLETPSSSSKQTRGSISRSMKLTNHQELVEVKLSTNNTINSTTDIDQLLTTLNSSSHKRRSISVGPIKGSNIISTIERKKLPRDYIESPEQSEGSKIRTFTADIHEQSTGVVEEWGKTGSSNIFPEFDLHNLESNSLNMNSTMKDDMSSRSLRSHRTALNDSDVSVIETLNVSDRSTNMSVAENMNSSAKLQSISQASYKNVLQSATTPVNSMETALEDSKIPCDKAPENKSFVTPIEDAIGIKQDNVGRISGGIECSPRNLSSIRTRTSVDCKSPVMVTGDQDDQEPITEQLSNTQISSTSTTEKNNSELQDLSSIKIQEMMNEPTKNTSTRSHVIDSSTVSESFDTSEKEAVILSSRLSGAEGLYLQQTNETVLSPDNTSKSNRESIEKQILPQNGPIKSGNKTVSDFRKTRLFQTPDQKLSRSIFTRRSALTTPVTPISQMVNETIGTSHLFKTPAGYMTKSNVTPDTTASESFVILENCQTKTPKNQTPDTKTPKRITRLSRSVANISCIINTSVQASPHKSMVSTTPSRDEESIIECYATLKNSPTVQNTKNSRSIISETSANESLDLNHLTETPVPKLNATASFESTINDSVSQSSMKVVETQMVQNLTGDICLAFGTNDVSVGCISETSVSHPAVQPTDRSVETKIKLFENSGKQSSLLDVSTTVLEDKILSISSYANTCVTETLDTEPRLTTPAKLIETTTSESPEITIGTIFDTPARRSTWCLTDNKPKNSTKSPISQEDTHNASLTNRSQTSAQDNHLSHLDTASPSIQIDPPTGNSVDGGAMNMNESINTFDSQEQIKSLNAAMPDNSSNVVEKQLVEMANSEKNVTPEVDRNLKTSRRQSRSVVEALSVIDDSISINISGELCKTNKPVNVEYQTCQSTPEFITKSSLKKLDVSLTGLFDTPVMQKPRSPFMDSHLKCIDNVYDSCEEKRESLKSSKPGTPDMSIPNLFKTPVQNGRSTRKNKNNEDCSNQNLDALESFEHESDVNIANLFKTPARGTRSTIQNQNTGESGNRKIMTLDSSKHETSDISVAHLFKTPIRSIKASSQRSNIENSYQQDLKVLESSKHVSPGDRSSLESSKYDFPNKVKNRIETPAQNDETTKPNQYIEATIKHGTPVINVANLFKTPSRSIRATRRSQNVEYDTPDIDVANLFKTPAQSFTATENQNINESCHQPESANPETPDVNIKNLFQTPTLQNTTKRTNTILKNDHDKKMVALESSKLGTPDINIKNLFKTPARSGRTTRQNKNISSVSNQTEDLKNQSTPDINCAELFKTPLVADAGSREPSAIRRTNVQPTTPNVDIAGLFNTPVGNKNTVPTTLSDVRISELLQTPSAAKSPKLTVNIEEIREPISNEISSESHPSDSMCQSLLKHITERVTSLEHEIQIIEDDPLEYNTSNSLTLKSTPLQAEIVQPVMSTPVMKRRLYTRNDPDDKTPDHVKSVEVKPVSSTEYLFIMDPKAQANTEKQKVKMAPSQQASVTKREMPSRASRRNIKTLSEEELAGASPEPKYVKAKSSQKITTVPHAVESVCSTSASTITSEVLDNDVLLPQTSNRRKVAFNDHIAVKEICSPAIVGDIIKNTRGRKDKNITVNVIVHQNVDSNIKPATKQAKALVEHKSSKTQVAECVQTKGREIPSDEKLSLFSINTENSKTVQNTQLETLKQDNKNLEFHEPEEHISKQERPTRSARRPPAISLKSSAKNTKSVFTRGRRAASKVTDGDEQPIEIINDILNVANDDDQMDGTHKMIEESRSKTNTTMAGTEDSSQNDSILESVSSNVYNHEQPKRSRTNVNKKSEQKNIDPANALSSAEEHENIPPAKKPRRGRPAKNAAMKNIISNNYNYSNETIPSDTPKNENKTIHSESITKKCTVSEEIFLEIKKPRSRRGKNNKDDSNEFTKYENANKIKHQDIVESATKNETKQNIAVPETNSTEEKQILEKTHQVDRNDKRAEGSDSGEDKVTSSTVEATKTAKRKAKNAKEECLTQDSIVHAADSTTNQDYFVNPNPVKNTRGRTRKQVTVESDQSKDKLQSECQVTDESSIKAVPAEKKRTRKNPAKVEIIPEESLNESHFIKTLLPNSHMSTPLSKDKVSDGKNVQIRRGRRKAEVPNPPLPENITSPAKDQNQTKDMFDSTPVSKKTSRKNNTVHKKQNSARNSQHLDDVPEIQMEEIKKKSTRVTKGRRNLPKESVSSKDLPSTTEKSPAKSNSSPKVSKRTRKLPAKLQESERTSPEKVEPTRSRRNLKNNAKLESEPSDLLSEVSAKRIHTVALSSTDDEMVETQEQPVKRVKKSKNVSNPISVIENPGVENMEETKPPKRRTVKRAVAAEETTDDNENHTENNKARKRPVRTRK
ncbi:mucin-2 [Uranotaenia lowii]|uniref:mucin-2 n=1 Tax=Uranotaenia lowii TaxID=190385 RepID=UPI00247AA545|nr:mucin-2 [Uranotaenia lowii]